MQVFLCSTFSDLRDEREAVLDAIRRLQLRHDSMEFFGARTNQPIETCLQEVRRSNILVVIVGHRYGSLAPGMGISFSEAEYDEGYALQKPCLVYMRDEKVQILPKHMERDPDKFQLLKRWKENLQERHTVAPFQKSNDLAVQVAADLSRTISELEQNVTEKHVQLQIVFDPNDQTCNDVDDVRHVYRVRLVNSSHARTAHDTAIRVVGFRRLHGETPEYVVKQTLDRFLKPMDPEGPRFDVHAGGREPVDVVEVLAHDEPPGWIYVCSLNRRAGDGIEAGRYVMTLRTDGQNCIPDEQQFYVKLNEEEFILEPFSEVSTAKKGGRRLVEKHRATERWRERIDELCLNPLPSQPIEWCYEVHTMFANLLVNPREHRARFDELTKGIHDGEDISSCVRRGIDYLKDIKELIRETDLR